MEILAISQPGSLRMLSFGSCNSAVAASGNYLTQAVSR